MTTDDTARRERTLRLHAYYYGFRTTGSFEIDKILCAVASAGKAFHHTEEWNVEANRPNCDGNTPVEWIQNAADSAAAEIAKLDKDYDEKCAELYERDAEITALRERLKDALAQIEGLENELIEVREMSDE